jgi:hypothetical protein
LELKPAHSQVWKYMIFNYGTHFCCVQLQNSNLPGFCPPCMCERIHRAWCIFCQWWWSAH